MRKLKNPFVTGGYMGPDYFCDREQETSLLLKAIASKRNVTLISLRRMGKTGLLKHVKYQLELEKNSPVVIYADLLPTMNGNDMLNTMSSVLLQVKYRERNIIQKLLALLATLRPRMTFDSLTGKPSVQLTVETPSDIQFGFSHLLRFISEVKQDLVFMLDEFQQINRYPENNMESLLRSVIQTYPGIPFIFSGSSKHMLESMFSAAGRPFYQSAELMYLEKIKEAEYRDFIVDKFSLGHRQISTDAIDRLCEWTRLHTFYVQHVCNLLYETGNQQIDVSVLNQVLQRVLVSNEPLFTSFRNLIPAQQYSLLRAIAVENGIDKPTSGAFIQKHGLISASSVASSLKALADKEMIVLSVDKWQVYDVFFSRWLEYHYK